MNAQTLAQAAYGGATLSTRTPRDLEFEILSRATRALRLAETRGAENFAALAGAVHENRRIWAAFAVAVADDLNGLPRELRSRILYLAEFTRLHSRRVLAGDATIGALIDINAAILHGLRPGRAAA